MHAFNRSTFELAFAVWGSASVGGNSVGTTAIGALGTLGGVSTTIGRDGWTMIG